MCDIKFSVVNPFLWRTRVMPEDIDEQGHASNVSFVQWISRAAVAHSEALGFDFDRYREIGGIFVLRRHEIDYLAQAFLDDEIIVATWPIPPIRGVMAYRRHEIARASDGKLLAIARNTWVFYNIAKQRPMRMPKIIIETFDPGRYIRRSEAPGDDEPSRRLQGNR